MFPWLFIYVAISNVCTIIVHDKLWQTIFYRVLINKRNLIYHSSPSYKKWHVFYQSNWVHFFHRNNASKNAFIQWNELIHRNIVWLFIPFSNYVSGKMLLSFNEALKRTFCNLNEVLKTYVLLHIYSLLISTCAK